jgi:hypothetical protein
LTTPEILLVGRIVIERTISDEYGDVVFTEAVDANGEPLALVESLGMIRLAEDTVIRTAMDETPDDTQGDE